MVLNDLPWKRTEIIRLSLRLQPSPAFRTLVDHDGYSISSEGFLPTVVDIMLTWIKFSRSSPFYFLIPKMSMFTLAISCLTTSNLPWFMDLTFQVPMQYCSLQQWTSLPSQALASPWSKLYSPHQRPPEPALPCPAWNLSAGSALGHWKHSPCLCPHSLRSLFLTAWWPIFWKSWFHIFGINLQLLNINMKVNLVWVTPFWPKMGISVYTWKKNYYWAGSDLCCIRWDVPLQCMNSLAMAQGLSCVACGTLVSQPGLNPHPLHCQVNS